MDIDKIMEDVERQREEERQKFLQKALSKMTGELAFQSFLMLICKRFELSVRYGVPDVAYILAEHYIENVDEPFESWINKDDAPLVRPLSDAKKIFHEFNFLDSNLQIIRLANQIYGLDLDTDYEEVYMYSLSFDFNSFTPINIREVKDLKNEIRILEKHNVPCDDLKAQLNSFGLTDEQLELI